MTISEVSYVRQEKGNNRVVGGYVWGSISCPSPTPNQTFINID